MLFMKENFEESKAACIQIFKDMFGAEIEYVVSNKKLGPMGQFIMDFKYLPDDILIRLDIDRGSVWNIFGRYRERLGVFAANGRVRTLCYRRTHPESGPTYSLPSKKKGF